MGYYSTVHIESKNAIINKKDKVYFYDYDLVAKQIEHNCFALPEEEYLEFEEVDNNHIRLKDCDVLEPAKQYDFNKVMELWADKLVSGCLAINIIEEEGEKINYVILPKKVIFIDMYVIPKPALDRLCPEERKKLLTAASQFWKNPEAYIKDEEV